MSFGIKPLFDRVFVKKDDEETLKPGGAIIMPKSVKGRCEYGTVVAVGEGMRSTEDGRYITPVVEIGDRVFVKAFSGYTIRYLEEEVHVFQENEIIGIIEVEA